MSLLQRSTPLGMGQAGTESEARIAETLGIPGIRPVWLLVHSGRTVDNKSGFG